MHNNIRTLEINQMHKMSIDDIVSMYRQGYRLEELYPNMDKILPYSPRGEYEFMSPATCPTPIVQGTTKTLTIAVTTLGTPSYTPKFYVDGALKTITATWNSSNNSFTFPWTFNETVASHTYAAEVVDSCITGVKTSNRDTCTVTINLTTVTCQSISNVGANPSTLTLGGTVRLTATVTPSTTTTQEFDVDFKDGTTTLNTTPITTVNHIATFDWTPATSKAYSIKAYSGTCISPTATPVTVSPVPTCTSLSLTAPSTGARGGSITLSAMMSPVASGVGVVFKDGTTPLATRSTDGTGKATYIWSIPTSATLGDHTISASIPGTTCTNSKVVSITEAQAAAGGGGAIVIAAVALVAAAIFMMRKPPTSPT